MIDYVDGCLFVCILAFNTMSIFSTMLYVCMFVCFVMFM